MVELIASHWWILVVVVVLYLLTKGNRVVETKKKKRALEAVKDAEDLASTVVSVLRDKKIPKKELDKVLVEASHQLGDKNRYKRALVGGIIESFLDEDETQEIPVIDGSHTLDQLAKKAVAAKSKKAKVKKGLKKAGRLALTLFKSGLL